MEDYIEVPPIPKTPTPHEVVQRLGWVYEFDDVWFDDSALDGYGVAISDIDESYGDRSAYIAIIKRKSPEVYKEELKAYKQAGEERNKIIRQNENIQKRNDKLRQKEEKVQAVDPEFQEYLRLKEKFGE